MNAVGTTALLVAAIRAEETKRPDPLFQDPFADQLAGDTGRQLLAEYRTNAGPGIPIIEVRTRYYDEALAAACEDGVRQFVLLAAGMDARAFRLPWPAGSHLFELDQPELIAMKNAELADVPSRCVRTPIAVNLAEDFATALRTHGFDPQAKTAWLVEGLLQYLDDALVAQIFTHIDALSAAGSRLYFDVVGKTLLASPVTAAARQLMQKLGAPWTFGCDDPEALVEKHGWDAVVIEPAVIGNTWQRWPFPAIPPQVPGVPRNYLVTATKRATQGV